MERRSPWLGYRGGARSSRAASGRSTARRAPTSRGSTRTAASTRASPLRRTPARSLDARTADGKIIVGGDFANVDGAPRSHVARLNADGTLDTAFNPGAGPNGTVNAVRALAGGQVLIGGSFTSVDAAPRGGVARLNADGSLDAGFVTGPAARTSSLRSGGRTAAAAAGGAVAAVLSFDVQASDGKVVIGGIFDQLGAALRHNVGRLNADGTVDATFDPGAGPDSAVHALQLQPDGRTLLGGDFASVDGLERRGAARLLGDTAAPVSDAVVSVAVNVRQVTAQAGAKAKFTVMRVGGDVSSALVVNYRAGGSAMSGVDYKPLPSSVTIAAGQTTAIIKVKLLTPAPDAPPTRVIKLKLKAGGGYAPATVGATAKVILVRQP